MLSLTDKQPASAGRSPRGSTNVALEGPRQTIARSRRESSCTCGGSCPRCQGKSSLTIGAPDDAYEREADAVADRVMRAGQGTTLVRSREPTVQRKCTACEQEEEDEHHTLQPKRESSCAVSQVSGRSAPAAVHDALASPGRPLPAETRAFFEPLFGCDFASVRVHSDGVAARSARDVNAKAYTVGHDVAFGAGQFSPGTREGQGLLAHELAHVVQQTRGSNPVLRRQEETRPIGRRAPGQPRSPALPVPDVIVDPTALSEPRCPRVPTHLGNLVPMPSCDEAGEDIDGTVFQFCADSDVLSDAADLGRLRTLVSSQPSGTTFRVRAYASVEGPGTGQTATLYNRNLSCHRLNRVIRELLNLGVQERQLDAVSRGPTERFGTGLAARPRNRVAVIEVAARQQAPRADATGMTMAQIRDAAKQRIASGDYPIAADAYFARWSCGRWRTLAEAVARTTVLIEGAETNLSATTELGTTSGTGANTIVISRSIADAIDPIGCAANRIVDLTFHHFSRPVLSNFEDQHRAGMHLVHLAGLSECRIPLDPLNVNIDVRSRTNPVDPFIGFVPRCADQPLPGPIGPQRGPPTMETPPTFNVTSLTTAGTSGAVVSSGSSNPVTVGVEPDSPFEVRAEIDAAGTPAGIANFEIGFVQTVMGEEWINTHVDGRRERRRFPLPLRDGPARNDPLSEPPWFDTNAKVIASVGTNQVTLTDAPNFRAFRMLPDIPSSEFFDRIRVARPGGGNPVVLERPAFSPRLGPPLPANSTPAEIADDRRRRIALANNVPDRGHRVLTFNTWVVARRRNPPAPATLGATQFLRGLGLTFRLDADWSPTGGGGVIGAGSYDVTSRSASASDATAMMLRGATPLDFVGPTGVPLFAEFLDIDDPLPRSQAGGLSRAAYFNAVQQIAQPHRTDATMRGEVVIRINVDVATGRVILDTPDLQRGAIRVLSSGAGSTPIDTPETRAFARAIFPEVRKLIAAPGFAPNEPRTGTMPVAIRLQAVRP